MKTSVSIPDSIFKAAEEFGQKLGISRSQLYADALRAYLKERDKECVTRKLDEIYSKEPSTPNHVIRALQHSSLAKDEW
jgi:antitoxin MazE6